MTHVPGDQGPAPDIEDLEAARRGNRRAFERIVVRHEPALFAFARRLCGGDAELAEDAVQTAFVTAWRGLDSFRGDGSVRSWLFTMTRFSASRVRRTAGREQLGLDETPLVELGVAAGWGAMPPTPEAGAAAREEHDQLVRCLATLSEADQVVLQLRDLDELSGPEAARILDITEAALKTRLHRARLRLMAAMRQEGPHGA